MRLIEAPTGLARALRVPLQECDNGHGGSLTGRTVRARRSADYRSGRRDRLIRLCKAGVHGEANDLLDDDVAKLAASVANAPAVCRRCRLPPSVGLDDLIQVEHGIVARLGRLERHREAVCAGSRVYQWRARGEVVLLPLSGAVRRREGSADASRHSDNHDPSQDTCPGRHGDLYLDRGRYADSRGGEHVSCPGHAAVDNPHLGRWKRHEIRHGSSIVRHATASMNPSRTLLAPSGSVRATGSAGSPGTEGTQCVSPNHGLGHADPQAPTDQLLDRRAQTQAGIGMSAVDVWPGLTVTRTARTPGTLMLYSPGGSESS